MEIPLNITGGTYRHRSLPLSAQTTRNLYPELQDDPFVQDKYTLQSWPGLVLFGSASGADRGMLAHKGVLYKVSGTILYSVDSSGVHTNLGTIAGTGQCILTGFGDNVLIANSDGNVYEYTSSVAELVDGDLETPDWVAHLNNRAIYGGDAGRFACSAVGDATDINGLDYATAESNADDIVRGYVFGQELFLFGEQTTERWFNSGVGRPPFDRIEGGIIPVGLASRMSVASNDRTTYWLGDDRQVYNLGGIVSNIPLATEFQGYGTVNDAIGFCCKIEGQRFYHLSFPTEDKTWCYSESVGQWFELSRSGTTGRDLANSYAYIYGKHLIADYRNSNIYYWDIDTYTENAKAITRQRDTGPLHGGVLGAPGKDIELNKFTLIMERGLGDTTTTDPIIMLQLSIDGGRTFGTEHWAKLGKSGQFLEKVEWHGLGRFSEGIVRVKMSDPVRCSIHSATADIQIAI